MAMEAPTLARRARRTERDGTARPFGRCEYRAITDEEALAAFRDLAELEGIVPALETAHAVALAGQLADGGDPDSTLVNLSGRGDKAMQ